MRPQPHPLHLGLPLAALLSLGCSTRASPTEQRVDITGDVTDDADAFTHVDVVHVPATLHLDAHGITALLTVPRDSQPPVQLSLTGALPVGDALASPVDLRLCACHPRARPDAFDVPCDDADARTCTDLRATLTGSRARLDCDADATDCLEHLDATLSLPPNPEFFGTLRLVHHEDWLTEWYDGPLL
ncbi:MAG: hypothetical protein U0414_23825 [Polyangiaceae bacterium]